MQATIQSNFRTKYIIKSVLFCVVFTGLFVVFSFAKNFIPNNFERLAHGIICTLAAFLTTILFSKFDGKKFSDIRLTFERKTIAKVLYRSYSRCCNNGTFGNECYVLWQCNDWSWWFAHIFGLGLSLSKSISIILSIFFFSVSNGRF